MSDNKGVPIQNSTSGMKHHWWYDGSQAGGAGVNNSPPKGMAFSPANNFSTSNPSNNYLSQSPPMADQIAGGINQQRRNSLKLMKQLSSDFAN